MQLGTQSRLSKQGGTRIANLRWWMLGFFVLIMIVNYIDRSSLSIAMPLIGKDMHLNAQVTGIILSSFGWTYALMQLPGGWLVDKLKPRKVVSASLIGWGVIEGLTGLANSVTTLIGMRMLLGAFEGPVQNGANASLQRWLRRDERARGSTLIDGGGPLGSAVRRAAGHQPDHLAGHLAVGVRCAGFAHRRNRHPGLALHAQPAGRSPPDHARRVEVPREDRRHRGIQRASCG